MMTTEARFVFAQLADWYQVRAERERQVASALRAAGKQAEAQYAQVRSEVWDEAAVHCRETGRNGETPAAQVREASRRVGGGMHEPLSNAQIMGTSGDANKD